ncbi:MAG: hypothetical protein JNN11_03300 [Candidatus Doudnabacteria bacterium]|nr:hypothetical protein [Candidatus Doudnabacteria bacterium]
MDYGFDAFLNSIKYLDKEDIVATAKKKIRLLDKPSTLYSLDYKAGLKNSLEGLLFWLEKNQRPTNISDASFQKFYDICKNLVRKEQLEKSSLDLFTKEE